MTASRYEGQRSYWILVRAFVEQLFFDEAISSDVRLRQVVIWCMVFLMSPCVFIIVEVFPLYGIVAARAIALHRTSEVTELLSRVVIVLVGYEMAAVGLLGVFAWDALVITHRDISVLGALPLTRLRIVAAKACALSAFVLAVAGLIGAASGGPFALMTTGNGGLGELVQHGAAEVVGTVSAGVFVFCLLVSVRAVLALLAHDRFAVAVCSGLQCLLIALLLYAAVAVPDMLRAPLVGGQPCDSIVSPVSWFVGIVLWLFGLQSVCTTALALHGLVATGMSLAAGGGLTLLGFMHAARLRQSATQTSHCSCGPSRVLAALGRLTVGEDASAAGMVDHVVMTLARGKQQQTVVASCVAIGMSVVAVPLRHAAIGVTTSVSVWVLWIPHVLAYCGVLGVVWSFRVPREIAASWVFRACDDGCYRSWAKGARAAMAAVVVPPAVAVAVITTVPVYGWSIAMVHSAFVCVATILMIELMSSKINTVPFSVEYDVGGLKLITRWWWYALGMFVFGIAPAVTETLVYGRWTHVLLVLLLASAIVAVMERRAVKSGDPIWTTGSSERGSVTASASGLELLSR